MAFDPKPTSWIENYSSDGTNITIPIATLDQLDAAGAHNDTGDIRQVLFALANYISEVWYALPVADRSKKMQISKSISHNPNDNSYANVYVQRFDTEALEFGLLDEPA